MSIEWRKIRQLFHEQACFYKLHVQLYRSFSGFFEKTIFQLGTNYFIIGPSFCHMTNTQTHRKRGLSRTGGWCSGVSLRSNKKGFSSVQALELHQPLSHGREMCHSNYSTIRTFLSCFNSLSVNRKMFPQVKGLLLTGYKCRRCFLLLFLCVYKCCCWFF